MINPDSSLLLFAGILMGGLGYYSLKNYFPFKSIYLTTMAVVMISGILLIWWHKIYHGQYPGNLIPILKRFMEIIHFVSTAATVYLSAVDMLDKNTFDFSTTVGFLLLSMGWSLFMATRILVTLTSGEVWQIIN